VGIMVASTFYLIRDISIDSNHLPGIINGVVMAGTFLLLTFTRIPSPFIVMVCLSLGAFI
jgi:chromate transporter